jgi:hypothetical protein
MWTGLGSNCLVGEISSPVLLFFEHLAVLFIWKGFEMRAMRRNDRAVDRAEAIRILENCEYIVLSTVGSDNQPYGVPLNFCMFNESIYFHCALEGHKIDNFTNNPRVSICGVGKTRVLASHFGTEYESTVVFGEIAEVFDSEKQRALEEMLRKYSGDFFDKGLKHIEASRNRTRVFRIPMDNITGKSRK